MKLKTIPTVTFLMVSLMFGVNLKVFSQAKYYKGYVILLTGDTLMGEIRNNLKKEFDNYTKATFRKTEKDPVKTYRPDKIKEYAVNGTAYISRNVDGDQVFVKRLSQGALNLYELQTEVMQMNDVKIKSDYYMEKGTGEFVKIKSGKFKKQLSDVMADNQEVIKDIETEKYEYDNILEVFNAYNKTATAASY